MSPTGYFELGCVEKSHSPAGKVNRMYENMDKNIVNMDKFYQIWTNIDLNSWTISLVQIEK